MTPQEEVWLRAVLAGVIRREGGFVDHSADPGGATNHGISLRYAQSIGLDLDGDGDTDRHDIERLSPERALALYRRDFFEKPGISHLPPPLWPVVLDWAVTSGPAVAVRAVQRVAAALGEASVREDGRLGPHTIGACERLVHWLGATAVVNALCDEREAWLRALVARAPRRGVFLTGWIARAGSFRLKERGS
ncbi:glycoside hydrolase family 108 protein [Pararhodospirillum photometricum]|uniref:Uncharacterized protein n=1 Tax=Pararhodospirillum photometricum DSM 122 TaxID=1150469 RepID=H6SNZ8_PARPM|nr:glycosyl hydrolase 108 family protein [Pararhodospirillum photometricum]CCG07070.1 Putative uncharacterized protein [Pararhodospirillum photometricum DSM 122]